MKPIHHESKWQIGKREFPSWKFNVLTLFSITIRNILSWSHTSSPPTPLSVPRQFHNLDHKKRRKGAAGRENIRKMIVSIVVNNFCVCPLLRLFADNFLFRLLIESFLETSANSTSRLSPYFIIQFCLSCSTKKEMRHSFGHQLHDDSFDKRIPSTPLSSSSIGEGSNQKFQSRDEMKNSCWTSVIRDDMLLLFVQRVYVL